MHRTALCVDFHPFSLGCHAENQIHLSFLHLIFYFSKIHYSIIWNFISILMQTMCKRKSPKCEVTLVTPKNKLDFKINFHSVCRPFFKNFQINPSGFNCPAQELQNACHTFGWFSKNESKTKKKEKWKTTKSLKPKAHCLRL